jgi:hypothetical protein
MDHRRLRFTMDQRHGRPRELTGAWPPATPGLKVAGEGVEEAAAIMAGIGGETGGGINGSFKRL